MNTWLEGSFLVLDLETTGLDRARSKIVEIGMAVFSGGRCEGARGELCDPGEPIPADATAVHGVTDADVLGKPDASTVLGTWLPQLVGAAVVVGYNLLGFDLPIVQRELRGRGVDWQPRAVDVYAFVDWHLRDWRIRKLTTLAQHYRVELLQAHSAAADARACGEILLHLVRQGLIPASIEEAAAESARLRQAIDEERARWGHWIYADRKQPGLLRMGCGKHQGAPLGAIDRSYFRWALGLEDLPDAVRAIFGELADAPAAEAARG